MAKAKIKRTRSKKVELVKDTQAQEEETVSEVARAVVGPAVIPVSAGEEESGQHLTLDEPEPEIMSETAAPEVHDRQVAARGRPSIEGGLLQKCMSVPSFRRRVISQLVKKLR